MVFPFTFSAGKSAFASSFVVSFFCWHGKGQASDSLSRCDDAAIDKSCEIFPTESNTKRKGAGCKLMHPVVGSSLSDWMGGHRINLSSLPVGAVPYSCYSGRVLNKLNPKTKRIWKEPGFADSAVLLVEDFLNSSEVMHLENLSLRIPRSQPQGANGNSFAYLAGAQYGGNIISSEPDVTTSLPDDAILNAVENRIAALLDIPASSEEKHLQVYVTNGLDQVIQEVHHDKNSGLVRQATALIYLTSPDQGGETLFPALPFHPNGPVPRTPEIQELARVLKDTVENQLDDLVPEIPWPPLILPKDSRHYAHIIRTCNATHAARDNATHGLSIQPQAGRAIFFWHETAKNGNILFDVFHMGCPVYKGMKLALQKFKNFNSQHAECQNSKWCRTGMQRAEEFVYKKKAMST